MIKIPYHFNNPSIDLEITFDFQYGPEELEDGTLVEFTPVNSEGSPVANSFMRSVTLFSRGVNGINWYAARFPPVNKK